jgi:hypothetical protein
MFTCYRFESEEQFLTLATAEGLIATDDDGNETLITNSHTHSIDVIGTIYEGGTYDEEGELIDPPVALDGFHVNTAGLAPEAWDQYLVVVNSPARVFLGGPTQAPSTDVLEQITQ